MKRIALALAFTLSFPISNAPLRANNPGTAVLPAGEEAQKAKPQVDPGTRKLSRRERKERISKLSEPYRQFLQDVEPIMHPSELDTFLLMETDAQREVYIREFWRRRDAAQGTSNQAFRDAYYARLEQAKEQFKQVSSDRARMYLIHGEPQAIIDVRCDRLLVPIQVWKYFYLPGFGHNVRFLFYVPRMQNDYRLWDTMMPREDALKELLSSESYGVAPTDGNAGAVFSQVAPGISRIEMECRNGDELLRAIFQMQENKTAVIRIFEPPHVDQEDVKKILRSVVIGDPNAPKLEAEFSVRYPAKQGSRTDAEITLLVPKGRLAPAEVEGAKIYSLDVTGEMMRDGQLYENFRYRFDFPGDTRDEKLPLIIDRFLRPAAYRARLRVVDPNSGAEAIVENDITVPEIFDTPEQRAMKEAGSNAVTALKEVIETNAPQLRIVPMADDLVSGFQKIETIAIGDAIKAVEFYLDGRKVMVKRQPPYTLELDFGDVPQARRIRAVALDAKGQVLTGDEIVVNTGTDPFRVRIVSPRVAVNLRGKTRVEVSARVPEGKTLEYVDLFYNDRRVARLFDPPFVQTVDIAGTEGVSYLRAVAKLKDDPTPPIEDVVMINTPQFMEEVTVHLVELPTTVISNGRPLTTLTESAFRVLDEGKPVKLAKFEHVKNLPLSIGMAVDTSGSMLHRMAEAQKAGAQFFQNVLRKGDKAFLVAFDTQPQMVQKWTSRLPDLNAGLAKLRSEESTSLYDAIVYSLYNFLGVKGQKALVVITDGRDTSSKFSFEQALEYARRAAVPVYGIGIGIRASDIDVRYKLGRFCSETGGNMYNIESASELTRIYDDIQNELRSQYVLGFYPPEGVKPGGKWREVTVQVSEGKAKTIRGYYP